MKEELFGAAPALTLLLLLLLLLLPPPPSPRRTLAPPLSSGACAPRPRTTPAKAAHMRLRVKPSNVIDDG